MRKLFCCLMTLALTGCQTGVGRRPAPPVPVIPGPMIEVPRRVTPHPVPEQWEPAPAPRPPVLNPPSNGVEELPAPKVELGPIEPIEPEAPRLEPKLELVPVPRSDDEPEREKPRRPADLSRIA